MTAVKIFFLLSVLLGLVFKDSFTNFFLQDDFFNIALARKGDWLRPFNLFVRPEFDFYFYRPLTTQFFWKLGHILFAWEPLGYHLVNFTAFFVNIVLVFFLTEAITKSRRLSLLATLFYSLSGSHFYRLFFLSQFQESFLATTVFFTVLLYWRDSRWGLATFVLALMSKETAVVTPLVLLVMDLVLKKRFNPRVVFYGLVAGGYILARIYFFGIASGRAYQYVFALKPILNNYFWYGLWSLGLPEHYSSVKIFVWPTLVNLKLVTGFGDWGNRVLLCLLALTLMVLVGLKNWWGQENDRRLLLFALFFFLLPLLPVAFFPFHKFAYSLSLPLFGVSLFLGLVFRTFTKRELGVVIGTYFLIAVFALQYNLSEHWATGKALTARRVFSYFQKEFPNGVAASNIYFRNTNRLYCSWIRDKLKPSQEVAYGLGGVDGLRLLYENDSLEVYFEDLDNDRHLRWDSLMIDSRHFVR